MSNSQSEPPPSLTFSIAGAVAATGGAISRTRIFDLIRNGEIDARKIGRRTVIIGDSLRAFLLRQPKTTSNN
jgi:hypothetical protein